ncbi:MAG: citryl-CoA lyase [Chloroflexi bacterium]|nr:MAG: citryl-CoA lyase [Actinobacteria bacterium 13_2_20CM_2_66_6]TME04792.1 MAG: citryl-CoA lyase [Chloroflexota bacterium]
MGWSTPDRIVVRGLDLADLIGNVSLGDFAFLELKGRLPSAEESKVFNAITITLVEHGMTPSTIAARLTHLGAPEALQGAVAAGLLGMGDRFGGPAEEVARMLQESLRDVGEDADLLTLAEGIVARQREAKRAVPGLGHPIHKPIDPRTPRLFEVAAANGFSGRYVELIQVVAEEATRSFGRELTVNATGAIGAIASELGFPWQICRGLAVMARAIGLVAHLQEEQSDPLATEIWARVEDEASEHLRGQTPGLT